MEQPMPHVPQPMVPPPNPSLFAGASPKLTFIIGVVVGIAVVSLVGFPAASFYAFGSSRGTQATAAATPPVVQAPTGPDQPPAPLAKADIKLKPSDYVRGEANAPVTIVSYTDLECPFCKRFHPSLLQALQEYQGKVKLVFRNFPLSFHQNAQKESEAAECVGKLGGAGKFWSFVDKIFERTTSNGTGFALSDLPKLAKEVGISESRFSTCLDQGEMTSKVQTDLSEGAGYGVGGTPTSFVNGTPLEGAVPYEQLKAAIDAALKQ